ncbi:hypothetical protein [Stutzerimonas sp. 381-2]
MTNHLRQQLFKPLKELTLFSYHVTALAEVEKAYQGTAVKAEALGSMHPK